MYNSKDIYGIYLLLEILEIEYQLDEFERYQDKFTKKKQK